MAGRGIGLYESAKSCVMQVFLSCGSGSRFWEVPIARNHCVYILFSYTRTKYEGTNHGGMNIGICMYSIQRERERVQAGTMRTQRDSTVLATHRGSPTNKSSRREACSTDS